MLRIALFVACACSVYSIHIKRHSFTHAPRIIHVNPDQNIFDPIVEDISPDDSIIDNKAPYDQTIDQKSPDDPIFDEENPDDQIVDQDPKVDEETSVPPYNQALLNYTAYEYPIKEYTPKGHFNLEAIFAVIDGVISALALKPGYDYHSIYESQATKLFNAAQENPAAAANRINCIVEDANESIKRLRRIMEENPIYNSVCKETPGLCDVTIQAIIDGSGPEGELAKEGEILLALGELAGLYESKYKNILMEQDQPDRWQALTFVISSKDLLMPLITSGVKVRQALNGDNCDSTRILKQMNA